MQQQCIFEAEAQTETLYKFVLFSPSDSAHVSRLDGRLYEMLMCIISSEAELVYLVTLRRMCVHSERDIQINSPL